MVATGGTPWQGGLGFSNPDNLAFDPAGHLWMVTDRSSSSSLDVFGNNSCQLLPRSGAAAGQALCFTMGPINCEICGPCFDSSGLAFKQLRQVQLGSNWPSGVPSRPPRPGVVAIRRLDHQPLLAPAG